MRADTTTLIATYVEAAEYVILAMAQDYKGQWLLKGYHVQIVLKRMDIEQANATSAKVQEKFTV